MTKGILSTLFLYANFGTVFADSPVEEIYSVIVDSQTVSEALVYHYNQMLRGIDQSTGKTITISLPEWNQLEFNAGVSTFIVSDRFYTQEDIGDKPNPFSPVWKVTLKNVQYASPPRLTSGSCAELSNTFSLHFMPYEQPNCSAPTELITKLRKQFSEYNDDNYHCYEIYKINYERCDKYFPLLKHTSDVLTLSDIEGRAFVKRDNTAALDTIVKCEQGDESACSYLFSHYAQIRPDNAKDTGCQYRVGEEWGAHTRSVDEIECQFHAYTSSLQKQCHPPKCTTRYIWHGASYEYSMFDDPPAEAWRILPYPPSLSLHERLITSLR